VSQTLEQVRTLVARGDVRVSDHGYEELAADRVFVRDVIDGLGGAVVVEDYPDYEGRAFWYWNRMETANPFM
jgi:hypothetical protein